MTQTTLGHKKAKNSVTIKRSFGGTDAAQVLDNVGMVAVDGLVEGGAAVTAEMRVSDTQQHERKARRMHRTCCFSQKGWLSTKQAIGKLRFFQNEQTHAEVCFG
jgi:hypothetical protein